MRPVAVFRQNGLDADDGIENVGAGVALEGGEALQIKVVILGGLIAEIAVFQDGKPFMVPRPICSKAVVSGTMPHFRAARNTCSKCSACRLSVT